MEQEHVAGTLETIALAAERGDAQLLTSDDIAALRAASTILKDGLRSVRPQPASAGKRWDEPEDAQLCDEFDRGMSIAAIAAAHGRTKAAIQLRLVKLERLDATRVRARDRGAVPA
jgi:hypothetical protein